MERAFVEHGEVLSEKGGREAVERKFSVVDMDKEQLWLSGFSNRIIALGLT